MAIKLDINIIPSYNTHTLIIGDASEYPFGTAINNPYLEVTPPGFQKVTLIFSPKNLNVYNSNSLNLTDSDCTQPLPDGIYKLKYSIQPNYEIYTEKSFFKIDQLLELFDSAFLKLDIIDCNLSYNQKMRKKLHEIELFIQSAVSAANKCNDKLATDLYKMAYKLLKQLNC